MSGGSKVQTTRTEPWTEQKPYLEEGFIKTKSLADRGMLSPAYYTGETLAGFDPLQLASQAATATYASGPRALGAQVASEAAQAGSLNYGAGAMGYGQGAAKALDTAGYAGLTPFDTAQYTQLLSGGVDATTFDPLATAYTNQALGQLTGSVLPGIRQQITQAQPGGGTRGDILQANAVAAAQKNISDNLAKAEFDAYNRAQDRRLSAAQMGLGAQQQAMGYGMQGADVTKGALGQYQSIMGAPMAMYDAIGGVGGQRQAMRQQEIDRKMAKYEYDATRDARNLQNYMAGISGEYGGESTAVGPTGRNPMLGILGGLAGAYLGGPAGATAGYTMGSSL